MISKSDPFFELRGNVSNAGGVTCDNVCDHKLRKTQEYGTSQNQCQHHLAIVHQIIIINKINDDEMVTVSQGRSFWTQLHCSNIINFSTSTGSE
jgi:hypothetical protein